MYINGREELAAELNEWRENVGRNCQGGTSIEWGWQNPRT